MKTLIQTALLSITLLTAASAQPVLNTIVYPENSTRSVDLTSDFTSTAYDYEDGGADLIWDFSDYDFGTEESITTFYNNVSEGVYASQFPGATAFERNPDGDEGYYVTSPALFNLLGAYIPERETAIVFNDPQMMIQTPITYNDFITDAFSGTITGVGFPTSISGSQTISYDAYGTLILPDQTFENVIRLKMISRDTQVVNFGPTTLEFVHVNTNYAWLLSGNYYSLLTINHADHYQDGVFDGSSTKINRHLSDEIVTGFATKEKQNIVALFPQPASDRVFIGTEKLSGQCHFTLYNSKGELLKTDEQSVIKGESMSLSLTDVPAGLHVLHIENEGKTYHQKLMVR